MAPQTSSASFSRKLASRSRAGKTRRPRPKNGLQVWPGTFGRAAFRRLPLPAFSHGFAGNRFFPATLATDDPFVANELSLPTFEAIRQPDGPTKTFDLSTDVALKLTQNFGIEIGDGYQFQKAVGSNLHTGFDNLDIGAKYQFLVSPEHEAILSLGITAEIGGTGSRAIGADRFSTIVPGFFSAKDLAICRIPSGSSGHWR